jgi:hypothetical protein
MGKCLLSAGRLTTPPDRIPHFPYFIKPCPNHFLKIYNMTGTATPGSTLPVTGGSSIPWSLVVMALGGLILVGGLGLAFARRS